jgi:hypothetical protein
MNSFWLSVLNTMVWIPVGSTLMRSVAFLSSMPRPKYDLIWGNCACNAGSKFEASNISNFSIPPNAFGKGNDHSRTSSGEPLWCIGQSFMDDLRAKLKRFEFVGKGKPFCISGGFEIPSRLRLSRLFRFVPVANSRHIRRKQPIVRLFSF